MNTLQKYPAYPALFLSACFVMPLSAAQEWEYDFMTSNTSGWDSAFTINNTYLPGGATHPLYTVQGTGHGVDIAGAAENVGGYFGTKPGVNVRFAGVYNAGSYDISGGDSLMMKVHWSPFYNSGGDLSATTSANELFQIGFVDSTSAQFGNGSNNGLWIGGLEKSFQNFLSPWTTTLDVNIMNESGLITTASTNKVFDVRTTAAQNAEISWYEFEVLLTNSKSGLTLDVDVDRWHYNYVNGTQTEVDTSFLNYSGAVTTSLDLSSLRPALGFEIEDSTQISVSGSNYDGAITNVPEPSSTLLGAFGLLLIWKRRRS